MDKGTDGEPGSWGGHSIPLFAFNEASDFMCLTWRKKQWMSGNWWWGYGDEAWGVVGTDFLNSGKTPIGLALQDMISDAGLIKYDPLQQRLH